MPTVRAGFFSREIDFDAYEMRRRDVTFAIKRFALHLVDQIVTAIENDPSRIVEVRSEVLCREKHGGEGRRNRYDQGK